jgi:hypothetical protein
VDHTEVPTPQNKRLLDWLIQKNQVTLVEYVLKKEYPLITDLIKSPELPKIYGYLKHRSVCALYSSKEDVIAPDSSIAFKMYAQVHLLHMQSKQYSYTTNYLGTATHKMLRLQDAIQDQDKVRANKKLYLVLKEHSQSHLMYKQSEPKSLRDMPAELKKRFYPGK